MDMDTVTIGKPRFQFFEPSVVTSLREGIDVHGRYDTPIGRLAGFLIESETGRVFYAVIQTDDLAPSRYYFVPISATEYDPARDVLCLSERIQELTRLPSYDLDTFVDGSDVDDPALERVMVEANGGRPTEPYRTPEWWTAAVQARERAQPGTVLGIETRGTVTHLGESRADETKRREDAVDEAAEQRRE